ncbi:hypothetical protein KSF78_0000315 [Schistosoma japonicum]|nr:hypothetical protein KSF78_0000315 [Schistosoma japonicum]
MEIHLVTNLSRLIIIYMYIYILLIKMFLRNRQHLGNATANRSTVTLPIFMTAENANKLVDLIDTTESPKKRITVNTTEDENTLQKYTLKFRLSDATVAKRLALQLYTICNVVIRDSNDNNNNFTKIRHDVSDDERMEDETTPTSDSVFARFNRQFRDTLRCFSRPSHMKPKMSRRERCSTSLDPDLKDINDNTNIEVTTAVQSSVSNDIHPTNGIVTPAISVSMPTPIVTSVINSCMTTPKSSMNDTIDDNIKNWSYSVYPSTHQMNEPTMITTNQSPATGTATTFTTFMLNSKFNEENVTTQNYEKTIPVAVEPIEVAAGEAQAELNERDKQVLHSLLMNKSPAISSSIAVNKNLSYAVTNTTLTTLKKSVSNESSSSMLSSFNNSSYLATSKPDSTFHTEPLNTTTLNTTTKQSAVYELSSPSINGDNSSEQYVNGTVFSSTIPTSSLSTFSYSSSVHTQASKQNNLPSPIDSNTSTGTGNFVQPKLDTTLGKQISNTECINVTTSEHTNSIPRPSLQSVITHPISVITEKDSISSLTINGNNNDIPISQSVVSSHNDCNLMSTGHIGSLYAPQPYETVAVDSNNVSNHKIPALNGFHSIDGSPKATSPSISSTTSDSFQSRIKPPSFTMKTPDSSKINATKVISTTTTTVSVEESLHHKHVTQNNNNNTTTNSFDASEGIKNQSKIDHVKNENSPSTLPILCSSSVSVTGIRPPSFIKAPSITPDKMKPRITTNGHSSANTSVTSVHDDDEITFTKKHTPTTTETTSESVKRHVSTNLEDSFIHSSSLPKPLSISSSIPGKVQSKLRPFTESTQITNSGIPAPSIMPPTISRQSHTPVPINNTSIPLPSSIRPPSRSIKSALAK